jgi:hypothetical protein
MLNDANTSTMTDKTKAVHDALIAAGYKVKADGDSRLDVTEKNGQFRGTVYVGRYVEVTRLATPRITRIANEAADRAGGWTAWVDTMR